jgi:cell division protein FtsQ
MLKQIDWKSVGRTCAWVIALAGLVVMMSFVEGKRQSVKCSNVKILIPGADNFIEREEIDAILKQNQGDLIGRNLEGINLNAIEDKIKANPYIAYAKVYADMEGVIHIEIAQREPLLRIINASNQDFYVDRNGLKMPVSANFTANVLVANGNITEGFGGRLDTLNTKLAADLYKAARFIKSDTLWDAQIEQLFVNEKNDIELIPRVGNQRVILGDADSIEVKMGNLMAFYKQAMPKVGWDAYKTINIKYTNQVVCERSKSDSLAPKPQPIKRLIKDSVTVGRRVMDSVIKDEIIKEIKNTPVAVKKPAETVKKHEELVKKPAEAAKKPTVSVKKPSVTPGKQTVVPKATEKKKTNTEKQIKR